MTEFACRYGDDRDAAIVAFLYDDPDTTEPERARFATHLPTCARCQAEVAAFRGVRAQLARWSPPEPMHRQPTAGGQPSSPWHHIPA